MNRSFRIGNFAHATANLGGVGFEGFVMRLQLKG
jgi:hypothetical protein